MVETQVTAGAKPRFRVKAGSARLSPRQAPRSTSRYLRDTRSNVLATRPAHLVDSRDDIRRAWQRAAGMAMDLIQNSGRLSGAADQVIADTVGSGLELAPKPDAEVLKSLGYDDKQIADWILLVKKEWKYWSNNPAECDMRGKLIVPQMIDIGLRHDMAFGEIVQIIGYMKRSERKRYGIRTGTKVLMVTPSRLVQDTNEAQGLFQGVQHDLAGRPVQYLFRERVSGLTQTTPYPAHDKSGRPIVVHIFEPNDPSDVRGISRLAPAFRTHVQHEMLNDATLQTAILQTVFAATLTSGMPSEDAFAGIEALKDFGGDELGGEFAAMYAGAMERAQQSGVSFGSDPQVSHLAPGEKFELHGTATPGPQHQQFSASLDREMARAIGITYESFTLDNAGATYASSRVGTSSIWPVVTRRRGRKSSPQAQSIFEAFLDEAVGTNRIPFPGGYAAFNEYRERVSYAHWRGPAKPSADDNKSAQGSGRRLENRTTTIGIEAGELGYDADELIEEQIREHSLYVAAGMPSPYEAAPSSGAVTVDDDDAAPQRQTEEAE